MVVTFHNSAGHGSSPAKKEGEVEGPADSAPTAATVGADGDGMAEETSPVAARHGETLQACHVALPHLLERGGGCVPVLCI
jgi:hypothetical protein